MKKLYVRGLCTNSFGALILYGVSRIGGGGALLPYIAIACSIQALVFFGHGLPYRSEKFYDLSGSATHFSVVAASLLREQKVRSPRQLFCALASTVWMTRLGTFLFIRINRDGKDERFDKLTPVWLSFMGAWTLQAAWVVLTQLPVLLVNEVVDGEEAPLGLWDAACLCGWALGVFFEFVADLQKFTFRGDPANRQRFITSGLWALCRHPNYFGEITMWACMAAATSRCIVSDSESAASRALRWAWVSPAFTAFLLLCVSGVPLVEKAGRKKWGDNAEYAAYVEGTSCVLPWFPATKDEKKKKKKDK